MHKYVKWLIPIIFFVSIFLLYLHNLTRDIYAGDVGDLVTAGCTWGIAHPTGYPLLVLSGNILCHLPLSIPPVAKVGLISVFASMGGLFIVYLFAQRITKNLFLSLLSTSILAFSYAFWLHAVIPEVFGLNNFFVLLIVYSTFVFYETKQWKYLYILGFASGLSLTHHHTVLFIFPMVSLLLLKHIQFFIKNYKKVFIAIGFFLLGLVPYIYVPIAASRMPLVNWDNASNLHNFIRLLRRDDYGGFAPSVVNAIPVSIKLTLVNNYFHTLVTNYSYQGLFLLFVGIIALIKKDKWWGIIFLCGLIFAGPFFVYYGANLYTTKAALGIIERFYTLSYVMAIFLIPFSLKTIQTFLNKKFTKPLYSFILIGYFLIIPAFMFYYNFARTDLSHSTIGNTLAKDILNHLPPRAVLFVSGDTTAFNIWYVRFILGHRKDVDIINPAGVGSNNFLDDQMSLYHQKNPEVPLKEVFSITMAELRKKRRIFSTYEVVHDKKNEVIIPKGLVFEIIDVQKIPEKNTYLIDVEKNLKTIHRVRRDTLKPHEDNLVAGEIPLIYSNAHVRVGDYMLAYYKDFVKAEHYYRRALWYDSDNPAAYSGLALAQFNGFKECNNAIYNMKLAIESYPVWKTYYLQLYTLYQRCKTDKKEVQELDTHYQSIFRESLQQGVKTQYKQ